MLIELPVGIADPRERLAETHRRVDVFAKAYDTQRALGIFSLIGQTPRPCSSRRSACWRPRPAPCCATCRAPARRATWPAQRSSRRCSGARPPATSAWRSASFPTTATTRSACCRRRDGGRPVDDHQPDPRPVRRPCPGCKHGPEAPSPRQQASRQSRPRKPASKPA
jgi:hypothetical protein